MADVDAFTRRGDDQKRPRGQALARLAARQHGTVATWQLKRLEFSSEEIHLLVCKGHLHRTHRGVYAVGHRRLSVKGRRMAAVLACGPHAVLSHASAIAHWELRPPADGPIDVTAPGRSRHCRPGIRVHSVRHLDIRDRATRDGIPVTTVHRTLLDYAEVAHRQQLRLAIDAAERSERFDLLALNELMSRHPGRQGLRPLMTILAEIKTPAPWTRSELERNFFALIREARIPEPQSNVLVAGELVDICWPGSPPLIVELDGYEFHKSRRQFELDRLRDTKLQLAGCRIIRITQQRIEQDPDGLVSDLLALLPDAAGA